MQARTSILIGTATLALSASPALAAGFEGAYWGASLGGYMAETKTEQSLSKPGFSGPAQTIPSFNSLTPTVKGTGLTTGVQVGYNWRMGPMLLGAELDVNYWGYQSYASQRTSFVAGGGNTRFITSTDSAEASYLITLRPRLGYLISEQSMIYLSAGLARSDLKYHNDSRAETTGNNGVTNNFSSSARSDNGKVFGLGYERAWSAQSIVRIDYQYVQFDRVQSVGNSGPGFNDLSNAELTTGFKTTAHVVRLGVNYKF